VNLPGRHKEDDENLVVADPITVTEGKTYTHEGTNNFRTHNLIVGSQRDAGQARPLVARGSGYRMDLESETFLVADTLRVEYGEQSFRGDGADNLIAAWQTQGSNVGEIGTLKSEGTNGANGVPFLTGAGVRRLTPLECERLQGWPDNWTRLTADGKPIPDSHRYRMIGNGVVAPVAEWIGHRLVEVDAWP